MNADQVKILIEQGLPGSTVTVSGEDDHFEAVIVSDLFDGQGLLQQQRRVYAALGELVGNEIHAITMQTYTPEQWKQQRKLRLTSE